MKSFTIIKSILLISFLSTTLLTFNSCSKKIYFSTSSVVPAARGYVKIKKDKNKNYTIEISISNLAEVKRLEGDKKTYVVWMRSNNENAKNIGQINSDTKIFSQKLSSAFHTVSSARPTEIFITAEEDGTVTYPGNFMILSTEIR